MTANTSPSFPEKLVSFLIASVAVLAAIITSMQTYASGKKAEADRASSAYAVQAMQVRASGQAQVSYERQGAYRTWYELDLQALGAELAGDDAAATRFRAVRDQIAKLSPVFGPEYYDPAAQASPDLYKYEAKLYIEESTRLTEQFTANKEVGNAWDKRANAFIVHLTLLAVALALYGLSTTLSGFVRAMFIVLGTFLAGVVVLWTSILMLTPIPSIPARAIDVYASGVGKAWYGDYAGAIQDFDSALAEQPNYANAYFGRGNAKFDLAVVNATSDYQSALTDFEAAYKLKPEDTSIGWNLGWTYYLTGRFDEAIATDLLALRSDPSLVGLQFNLALAQMVQGDFTAAEETYRNGVQLAIDSVTGAHTSDEQPPASFWYYMDAAAQDIDSLLLELDGNAKPWSQVPHRSTITADQTQLRGLATRMFALLRNTTTALEFTGAAPSNIVTANVSSFEFAQKEYDQDGNFLQYNVASSFAYGTNAMVVLFDYSGMVKGQSEIWKVYHNGVEDPTLRVVSQWALDEAGAGEKSISFAYSDLFIFSPGEYTVELYIDSHLAQRGTFIIESQ